MGQALLVSTMSTSTLSSSDIIISLMRPRSTISIPSSLSHSYRPQDDDHSVLDGGVALDLFQAGPAQDCAHIHQNVVSHFGQSRR
jgi:hypothetical protein